MPAWLARALEGIGGVRFLHDRRVRRTKKNIDHIVVAPGGIFVIDAKHYKGRIEIRNRGPFWKTDLRQFVRGRDCSALAQGMGWQVEAVQAALRNADIEPPPSITPVLCFIDGEWPLFRPPKEFEGVPSKPNDRSGNS